LEKTKFVYFISEIFLMTQMLKWKNKDEDNGIDIDSTFFVFTSGFNGGGSCPVIMFDISLNFLNLSSLGNSS